MLDTLRKARIAMSHGSLAIFNQRPNTRFCKEHLLYDVEVQFSQTPPGKVALPHMLGSAA